MFLKMDPPQDGQFISLAPRVEWTKIPHGLLPAIKEAHQTGCAIKITETQMVLVLFDGGDLVWVPYQELLFKTVTFSE